MFPMSRQIAYSLNVFIVFILCVYVSVSTYVPEHVHGDQSATCGSQRLAWNSLVLSLLSESVDTEHSQCFPLS